MHIQGSGRRTFQREETARAKTETTILIHSKDRHEIREVGRGLSGQVLYTRIYIAKPHYISVTALLQREQSHSTRWCERCPLEWGNEAAQITYNVFRLTWQLFKKATSWILCLYLNLMYISINYTSQWIIYTDFLKMASPWFYSHFDQIIKSS